MWNLEVFDKEIDLKMEELFRHVVKDFKFPEFDWLVFDHLGVDFEEPEYVLKLLAHSDFTNKEFRHIPLDDAGPDFK